MRAGRERLILDANRYGGIEWKFVRLFDRDFTRAARRAIVHANKNLFERNRAPVNLQGTKSEKRAGGECVFERQFKSVRGIFETAFDVQFFQKKRWNHRRHFFASRSKFICEQYKPKTIAEQALLWRGRLACLASRASRPRHKKIKDTRLLRVSSVCLPERFVSQHFVKLASSALEWRVQLSRD
jgi:hypothetical protein